MFTNSNDAILAALKGASSATQNSIHGGIFRPSLSRPGNGLGNAFNAAGNMLRPRPTKKPTKRPTPKPGQVKGGQGPKLPTRSTTPSRTVTRNGTTASVRASGGSGASVGTSNRASGGGHASHGGSKAKPAARGAAKPAVDPIKSIVDEIIAGMNRPLEDQQRMVREQTKGSIVQNDRLSDMYDGQVAGIRDKAGLDLGSVINRAAQLKGISAETIAKNQDYLRSLMGQANGGTQASATADAAQATQGNIGAINDQMAKDIAGQGQQLNDYMAQQQVIGRANQREMDHRATLSGSAAQREIDGQIAANKGKSAQMLYEMRAAEQEAQLKQAVAEQEWGLKAGSANLAAQKAAADLKYKYDKLAQDGAIAEARINKASGVKPIAPGRFGNVPKRYDSAISGVLADMNKRMQSEEGLDAPWRTSHQALVDQGLNPTTAAFLATKWFNSSITGSSPGNIRRMLANRGVSPAAQKRIITQAFGANGWKQATNGSGLAGAVSGAGNMVRDATAALGG